MLIKTAFIVSACLLALIITIFKLYVQKLKRSKQTVTYTHVMIWIFAFYILSAAILAFAIDGAANKTAAALFAVSPFIIGRFASYKRENFFSILQILCAALSAVYVYMI